MCSYVQTYFSSGILETKSSLKYSKFHNTKGNTSLMPEDLFVSDWVNLLKTSYYVETNLSKETRYHGFIGY